MSLRIVSYGYIFFFVYRAAGKLFRRLACIKAHKLSSPTSTIDTIECPGFIVSAQLGGAEGISLKGRANGMKTKEKMTRRSIATSHERIEKRKIVLALYRLRSPRQCV